VAKGTRPGRRAELPVFTEIKKVTEPLGQKNVAGGQVNPATEDTLSTRAAATQLPADLTAAGNLKLSVEEQAIALGIDVQARYNLRTFESYTPDVATFYLPSTGSIDLSNFLGSTWFIYATAGATGVEVIDCYLQISLDGGTTFRRAAGFSLLDADFVLGEWNSIDVPIMLAQARLEIVCSGEAPGALEAGVIRKA
jgi:hypothetical protein